MSLVVSSIIVKLVESSSEKKNTTKHKIQKKIHNTNTIKNIKIIKNTKYKYGTQYLQTFHVRVLQVEIQLPKRTHKFNVPKLQRVQQ